VHQALQALAVRLPTFAVLDEGLQENEQLYLLIERGSFWGMGYLEKNLLVDNINKLKELIEPMADNDFIRNSLFQYVEIHPEKKLVWNNEMAV
jgi:DNA polymerase-3 subunit epsilon